LLRFSAVARNPADSFCTAPGFFQPLSHLVIQITDTVQFQVMHKAARVRFDDLFPAW
jgi:hypothetical protein